MKNFLQGFLANVLQGLAVTLTLVILVALWSVLQEGALIRFLGGVTQEKFEDTEDTIETVNSELRSLGGEIAKVRNDLNDLKRLLEKRGTHFQSGSVRAPVEPGEWTSRGDGSQSHSVRIPFDTPFEEPPQVHIAINAMSSKGIETEHYIRVTTGSVVKDSFYIYFRISGTYIPKVQAHWFAYGQASPKDKLGPIEIE